MRCVALTFSLAIAISAQPAVSRVEGLVQDPTRATTRMMENDGVRAPGKSSYTNIGLLARIDAVKEP
jgi:hypothetical protein